MEKNTNLKVLKVETTILKKALGGGVKMVEE